MKKTTHPALDEYLREYEIPRAVRKDLKNLQEEARHWKRAYFATRKLILGLLQCRKTVHIAADDALYADVVQLRTIK